MTEENLEIESAEVEVENIEAEAANNDELQETEEAQPDAEESAEQSDDNSSDEKFPKKAVNALSRKNKQITKLRARMQELEAELAKAQSNPVSELKELNPDEYNTYADFLKAQMDALVDQKLTTSQSEQQKQRIQQEQESLAAQRDQYIIEQAQEAAKVFTDLPQVWQQNAHTLDTLPKEIADIFYSIENAPAAVYTLAKEGKLEALKYANPYIAAQEIADAQRRGLEKLSTPKPRVSHAPQPITKAKANGSVKKQLSRQDNVLKELGLK